MQERRTHSRNRALIESYIPMVRFIAAIVGPRCEVALHDLEDVNHSIIAIENGHVTGRAVGDGLMDFAIGPAFEKDDREFIANIYGKTTADNKRLRLSGYYIRNAEKEIVGLLCVTTDVTDFIWMKKLIEHELLMDLDTTASEAAEGGEGAQRALSVSEMLDVTCNQAMKQLGFTDPKSMRKDDKMKVIAMLNEKNLFAMKGIIKLTAAKLGMSEPSVYRYVRALKLETEKKHTSEL